VERAFASPVELEDRRILAEATREVVDWAVSRKLRDVVLESGGEKSFGPEIALETERLIRIGACADANTPAGGSGAVYDPVPVGRVQGAILRLLLARARHVLAASDLRRIRAVVRVEGETFTGIVYQPAEDRETVEAGKAATAVAKLAGLRLRLAGAPVILREMAVPSAATTVAILASAWTKHRIEPWVAMRSLQALYDGSWSRTPDREPDPYDPIEPSSDMSAHPPITPLDRAAPPELMKGGMDRTDFSIYSLVWDRFAAMEKGEAEVLDVRLDFTLEGKAGEGRNGDDRRPGIPLRVRFGGISGDGVEPAGGHPAASLRKHWRAFDGAAPEFEVVSALDWDCSPGELLDTMERNKVGRPSTYAKALERLHDKQLVQFPHGQGPLRLTPAGVATAITIELAAEALSDPAFSARLTKLLEEIETGTTGPRAVLCDLMPLIAPGHDPAEVAPASGTP
jgi:DNA topoisomerase IA